MIFNKVFNWKYPFNDLSKTSIKIPENKQLSRLVYSPYKYTLKFVHFWKIS